MARPNDKKQAVEFAKKLIERNPSAQDFRSVLEILVRDKKDKDPDFIFYMKSIKENIGAFSEDPSYLLQISYELIRSSFFDDAILISDLGINIYKSGNLNLGEMYQFLLINRLQAKKHKGQKFNDYELGLLQELSKSHLPMARMAYSILQEEYELASELIELNISNKELETEELDAWPIFKLLPKLHYNHKTKTIEIKKRLPKSGG